MDRNVAMARAAARRLSALWRTETTGPVEAFAAMATIRLPVSGEASPARLAALAREVSERHGIEASFVALEGTAWVRIAAQAYNADEEYDRLGAIFKAAS
jgi:hypothetical protein